MNPKFLQSQLAKLLALKDTRLDTMNGVGKDHLRNRPENSEASAFGQHQADAGSDAYDRDFALSYLGKEHDALHAIDAAIARIENGTYGICEISGKPIPQVRLEALPFARYTVECQAQLEKDAKTMGRIPVTSLFGLDKSEDEDEVEMEP